MAPESELSDLLQVALDFTRRLDQLGISYVIGGSLASSYHGEPRSTLDIDLVADLHSSAIPALAQALAADYYVDQDAMASSVMEHTSFNAIHLETSVKVDVFVAGDDRFEAERLARFERAQLSSSDEQSVNIDTPEHTMLRKLEWFRRGGERSERQWRDVSRVAYMHRDSLDLAHLQRWAIYLGISDLLDQVLSEVSR